MVSSGGFRGLTLGCQGACGVGGHDRVGPLCVPEGMLLLGHAVPLLVVRPWVGRAVHSWDSPVGGVGRFRSHAPPGGGFGS